jgi:hypothetical protein
MTATSFNPKVLKFCAWMGPAFVLMWVIGAAPLAHFTFVPPPSASNTALETVHKYLQHLTGIRIGCVFMIFSSALYAFWGVAVSMYARPAESGRPVLFYAQMICMAGCVVVIMFIGFFWGVAAFRPGVTSPDVTQALNDLGWFGVLFTGAPFTGWAFALAAAILQDKSERPFYPRWVAYLNIWAGLLYVEASLILFFKHGAFSQDGFAVFYVPVAIFFVWIIALSVMVIRAVNTESRLLASGVDTGANAATDTVSTPAGSTPVGV